MRRALFLVALALPACGGDPRAPQAVPSAPSAAATAAVAAPNAPPKVEIPMLTKWTGPHGGLPPFAKVKVDQFKPAFEAAMEENRRELATIAKDPAAPTF